MTGPATGHVQVPAAEAGVGPTSDRLATSPTTIATLGMMDMAPS
jgi:hypothetical protein